MIRNVVGSDLSEIVDIENLSFSVPWPRFMFKSHLGSPGFVLYEQDGIIKGYVIVDIIDSRVHLGSIAVHPKYVRCGIGTKLLDWCINFGKNYGANMFTLEVREKNRNVQMFYLKNGFEIMGIVPGYYIDDNAVAMYRDI
ncbi:MAG: GNAT family N-acetyltransferase [Methanosarcinaceae archaeon]|jgi:ribosomal-protein-alanine N-acetyltransferase|nr:GNAT family N-acetyltransferase [Methanosarcinaceae archaeon]